MTTIEWLTVNEAADALGMSTAQVYRRIEKGRLQGSRRASMDGKERLVIPAAAVKEFQASQRPDGIEFADENPDLLRASAISAILGIPIERVRRLVKDGVLPAKAGGPGQPHATIRVWRSVVEKYLEYLTAE
jgi:excisionase family DNA binding protein